MAAAPKFSRAAVEAAAKAAGLAIRSMTPAQKRSLCSAASATAPTATAAAGIGSKGPGAADAGSVTAPLGIKGAAGAGLGTSNGVPGAGLPASAKGPGIKGAAGAGLGTSNGVPGAGLAASAKGPGIKGAAGAGLGTSKGVAGAGLGANRAGIATSTAAAGGCAESARVMSVCQDLKKAWHEDTVRLSDRNRALADQLAGMKNEMSTMKADNTRTNIGIMVSGLGTFIMVASFFGPFVQKAWTEEAIAEVNRRAAACKQNGQGDASAKEGGATGNASAKATAADKK